MANPVDACVDQQAAGVSRRSSWHSYLALLLVTAV
jgi:hypothetical protein